ncbi:MAG: DNA mismatch repair protein MutS [bacterium]
MNRQTPMIQQYLSIKDHYPDCILFFRMGDFYEMFFEDAEIASRVLEITLTTREKGMPEPAPLCGVPYHSADGYLARMVESGYKVAICEQIEDPKDAKGIVKRAVTRIITPGTAVSPGHLPAKEPRYLACLAVQEGAYGLAFLDYSTGEFRATQVGSAAEAMDELYRMDAREIVTTKDTLELPEAGQALQDFVSAFDPPRGLAKPDPRYFDVAEARRRLMRQFRADTLEGFGIEGFSAAVAAAGAMIAYLDDTQGAESPPAFELGGDEPIAIPSPLSHITTLSYYTSSEYMVLDDSSKRNLELTRTIRDNKTKGSLFWLIDFTVTPMGGRTLLHWLHYPLLDPERINRRLDAVEFGLSNDAFRLDLRELITRVSDLERLTARVSTGSANPRDLSAIREALRKTPAVKSAMERSGALPAFLEELCHDLDPLEELKDLLERALVDEPPVAMREGGIIRRGYSSEVDELADIQKDAKSVIAGMEATERQRTGIGNLKVKYNKVFGYYIEVTKANLAMVPDDYIRKQTLVNAERYITPDLKELENKVLGAEDRLIELHYDLFRELREKTGAMAAALSKNARLLGRLDAVLGLADLAARKRFTRPAVDGDDVIEIKDGWHPVIAELVKAERFVPNDVLLDSTENQVLLITGPNMAGKSTVLRQTAIIVILAQMGSFVPASEAKVGTVDRIFTRVGASDVLVRGMSTFMVEMTEAANILHNATDRSLVLLDEIGRGTSTFDGLSIAWAVAEFLHDIEGRRARTMFATHYHELVDLAETRPRIKNYHILVKEWEGEVIFLRKMSPGSTSRSYGIQVARLAGLPAQVIERAKEILVNLESVEHDPRGAPVAGKSKKQKEPQGPVQLSFFSQPTDPAAQEAARRIKAINTESLTPLEALTILDELKRMLGE